MPVVFIHGVNTRDTDENYKKDVAARNELLKHRILDPLSGKGEKFKKIEIVNVYWGKHGVDFKWKLASLPSVKTLEHLGAGDDATPESDFELAVTVQELAEVGQGDTSTRLESLGTKDDLLKRAAEKDLRRFVEVVLSPLILSEMRLSDEASISPEQEGVLQALLAVACVEITKVPGIQAQVSAVRSDEELISLLKEKIQTRFLELVQERRNKPQQALSPGGRLESLGPDWWQDLKDHVGELFDRALNVPSRVVGTAGLDLFREQLHSNLSRFFGDVFVYLNERGEKPKPGPIVSTVLEGIRNAPRNHKDEPLIIITHSMGGNILYEILTHYASDLKVEFWASVAGQVAQFEEMKLFKASNKDIATPSKVTGLKPKVGYWLNVYDPVDSFSFKAMPVFADVDADIEYLTGAGALKAHSEYFSRASFYDLILEHIEKGLL